MTPFPNVSLITTAPKTVKRPKICFDEWNIWNPERAPGDKGAEETYTLSDALAVATWLNVFVRNCADVGMATVAQSVNVISPLMAYPEGVCRQTSYWPLMLFARYMRGKAVAVHVRCGAYRGPSSPEWVQSTCTVPLLDVSAARDGEWVNLAVVNVDQERSFAVDLGGFGAAAREEDVDVQVYMVGGEKHSVDEVNVMGNEPVQIVERTWKKKAGDKFVFERNSFTLLRWKVSI